MRVSGCLRLNGCRFCRCITASVVFSSAKDCPITQCVCLSLETSIKCSAPVLLRSACGDLVSNTLTVTPLGLQRSTARPELLVSSIAIHTDSHPSRHSLSQGSYLLTETSLCCPDCVISFPNVVCVRACVSSLPFVCVFSAIIRVLLLMSSAANLILTQQCKQQDAEYLCYPSPLSRSRCIAVIPEGSC